MRFLELKKLNLNLYQKSESHTLDIYNRTWETGDQNGNQPLRVLDGQNIVLCTSIWPFIEIFQEVQRFG
jgi:hypothetical protein